LIPILFNKHWQKIIHIKGIVTFLSRLGNAKFGQKRAHFDISNDTPNGSVFMAWVNKILESWGTINGNIEALEE